MMELEEAFLTDEEDLSAPEIAEFIKTKWHYFSKKDYDKGTLNLEGLIREVLTLRESAVKIAKAKLLSKTGTTLTLLYAIDEDGIFNFSGLKPEQKNFIRETIKNKNVILGRIAYEEEWDLLKFVKKFFILSRRKYGEENFNAIPILEKLEKLRSEKLYGIYDIVDTVASVLGWASNIVGPFREEEVFCIGGKKTLEALAPFASKITVIGKSDVDPPLERIWMPEHIVDMGRTVWEPHSQIEKKGYFISSLARLKKVEF